MNGYWYDVKAFIPKHPGGPIIEKYIGADVTSSFYGMHRHPEEILARRTPVAKLKLDKDALRNKDINYDFWLLWHRYKEQGVFETSMPWIIRGTLTIFMMFTAAFYSAYYYPTSWFFNGLLVGNIWN